VAQGTEGTLFLQFRQPMLIAYIVAGVAVGPAFFGRLTGHDQLDLLAQARAEVLLFAVYLKLGRWHGPGTTGVHQRHYFGAAPGQDGRH